MVVGYGAGGLLGVSIGFVATGRNFRLRTIRHVRELVLIGAAFLTASATSLIFKCLDSKGTQGNEL